MAGDDEGAHQQGNDRAEGEEHGFKRQLVDAVSLRQECATELVVAPCDTHPGDKTGETGGVDQPGVGGAVADEGRDKAQRADRGGADERWNGDAAGVQLGEKLRGLAAFGQSVEHAGRRVESGVACRQDGGEDDGIHDGCGCEHTSVVEDEGEGGHGDVVLRRVQQSGVGEGDEEADDGDGADVEQQDADEDGANGLGDVTVGVFCFTSGDGDELGALEGKARDHEDAKDACAAVDEGGRLLTVGQGPVAEAGGGAAEDAEDHQDAKDEEEDDDGDFDEREPEFAFTIGAGGQGIEPEEDGEEDRGPYPTGGVGRPVLHDQRGGREFGGDCNRPVVPIIPTDGEAEAGGDEASGVFPEAAGQRNVGSHFAEGLHQQEDHEPDECVSQECAAGACVGDGGAGGDEEARADGTADGDHVHVPGFEGAAKLLRLGV